MSNHRLQEIIGQQIKEDMAHHLVSATTIAQRVLQAIQEEPEALGFIKVGSQHEPMKDCHAFGGMTTCDHEYIPFYFLPKEEVKP